MTCGVYGTDNAHPISDFDAHPADKGVVAVEVADVVMVKVAVKVTVGDAGMATVKVANVFMDKVAGAVAVRGAGVVAVANKVFAMTTRVLKRGPAMSPNCHECPFAANGRPVNPVPGIGPDDPLFVVVGEGPGRTEVMRRTPFVGPSGRLLDRVLMMNRVERDSIWVTNATLCLPPPWTSPTTIDAASRACHPRLMDELANTDPAPIITLGGSAARAVLGDNTLKITQVASSLHGVDLDLGLRDVVPTHHPARILRGGDGASTADRAVDLLFMSIVYDVGKIKRLAEGKAVVFSEDVKIEADDADRALVLMKMIATSANKTLEIAVDVETDGLDSRKVSLTAVAIATSELGVSIAYPMFRAGDAGREAWCHVRDLIRNPRIRVVYHNRLFDEVVLKRYGIVRDPRAPVDDTMLMHHATFPGQSHKLQDVVSQFWLIRPWKSEFRRGLDDRGKPAEVNDLLRYNALDALTTVRTRTVLDRCLVSTQTENIYAMDNALAPVARGMHSYGIPVHRPTNRELHAHFTEIIDRTRTLVEGPTREDSFRKRFVMELAKIAALKKRKADPETYAERMDLRFNQLFYGISKKKTPGFLKGKEPIQFSVSNPDHVAAYLAATGNPVYAWTAGGKPSTKKDILEDMAHIPEVRTILEYRGAAKLNSTFVVGVAQRLESTEFDDWGRLHPEWDIHKITGRWGSSPNCQNWAKENVRGRPNLRKQVVAPPGRTLVSADYAQLEARLIALLSGDPRLVSVFMDNFGACEAGCLADAEPIKFCMTHDLHTALAVEIFPNFFTHEKSVMKEMRDLTKRVEYGAFYGAALDTLYQTIVKEMSNVERGDVEKCLNVINRTMPGVHQWHQRLIREVMSKRELRSMLGRRRVFPLDTGDVNVIYNFTVQASGADVIDIGILNMTPRLAPFDAHMIIHGHDSVVLEGAEDDADDVADIVTDALTQTHTINDVTMFFPAKASIAKCWADL